MTPNILDFNDLLHIHFKLTGCIREVVICSKLKFYTRIISNTFVQ